MEERRDHAVGTRARTNWLLVAGTGLAVFMAQLDTTVVHVALPTIERQFGTATSLTQWVVLGYVLPMIALSLPGGRWLDGVGHRAALLFAVTGFAATSMAVGLAPAFGWLIGARIAQGAFAAVLFALIPVLTVVAAAPQHRARAMGIVMTLGPLGGLTGPAVGGFVIEHVGWQWIFFLNVPVSLLVAGIGIASLPAGRPLRLPGRGVGTEMVLLSAGAVFVMLALALTADRGPAWLLLAFAALPFLLRWHRGDTSAPVRELIRAPGMAGPHVALVAEMAAVMAVLFVVPFHLQRTAGASPAEVGLTMLAFPLGVMALGLIGGVLADRWTLRLVATGGAVMVTAGVTSLIMLGPGWGVADLAWRLALIGAGAGLFAGPNQTMAMTNSPGHLLATTGASTSVARQIGLALGPALATTIWAMPGYDITGMRAAVGAAAVLAAISVLALLRTPEARPTHHDFQTSPTPQKKGTLTP